MLLGVLRVFTMAAEIEGLAIGEAMVLRRVKYLVVADLLENCREGRVRFYF